MKDVEAAIDSVLKPLGFKKSGRTWRRENAETIALANLQGSSFGGSPYLNLGIFLKTDGSTAPKEQECHIRWRPLTTDGGALPSAPADIQLLVREVAVPWLTTLSSREGIAGLVQSNAAADFLIHRKVRDWLASPFSLGRPNEEL